ncbi:MAG: PHP domain-containing protein [Spirochaetota bacterium]
MPKKEPASNLLRCDFHCHSYYSDGMQSPTAVAAAMKQNQVSIFALTDHDTISGVSEAQAAARKEGICCLGGIELTIQWSCGTFHMLGLNLQYLQVLEEPLAQVQASRKERNGDMMKKLRKHGVDIDETKLQEYCETRDILNRSHIAAYLVAKGYSTSYNEAFRHYLAHGACAYVPIEGPSAQEGIEWIHAARGRALLAHPHSLNLSWNRFKNYLDIWHKLGLDGLEISHPGISLKENKSLLKLAQYYRMQYSGGSDYHRGETVGTLGRGTAGRPIDLPAEMAYMKGGV